MNIPRLPVALIAAALSLSMSSCLSPRAQIDFHEHVGIQMWSLRATTLAKGLPASLDLVKGWGLVEIEGGGGVNGMKIEQVRAAFDAHGLTAVSTHVSYEQLTKNLAGTISDARILGAKYAICPWIPHEGAFTAATVQKTAADFNRWGAAFRAAGISFGYHPHGYELVPTATAGETLLDDLIRATSPDSVCYEMDVFWIYHGGGDPVTLLNRYAGRWVALHVKDIRKGAPYGQPLGHAPATDNVAVGAGQIDWKAVIGTSQKIGVKYYFLEDETPDPLANIPASLAYLKDLKI